MKKYIKNYLKHFWYIDPNEVMCEICWNLAQDVHHIKLRSRWGWDEVTNLIALCRPHHDMAHFKREPYIQEETLENIIKNR